MIQDVTYHLLTEDNAIRLAGTDIFDNDVDQAQLTAFLASPTHALYFAEDEGTIVGFASASILLHPDKHPICFVNEVDVAKEVRRQGIATNLCIHLLRWARAEGCKGIWLATEADNTAARALYRSLAGRETLGIVVYDWDGVMDD